MENSSRIIAVFLISAAATFGQSISGGTAAIMVRTPSRVALAIDSKEVYRDKTNTGLRTAASCTQKLRRIGKYVAVVAGFSRGSGGFDALEILASESQTSDTLETLITRARTGVGERFQSLLRDLHKAGINIESFHRRDEAAIQIGLAGVEDGVTKMAVVEIFFDEPTGVRPLRYRVQTCPGDCGSNTYAYLLGTHEEMGARLASSPKLLKQISADDMKKLIALEEQAHPEVVGGPITTAMLSSRGGADVEPGNCGPIRPSDGVIGSAGIDGTSFGISAESVSSLLDDQIAGMTDLQCRRSVRRFLITPRKTRYLDNLEFDIEMHTGQERYTAIRRKRKDYRRLDELPGSWSSGELADVLAVTRDAVFRSGAIPQNHPSGHIVHFEVPASLRQWYLMVEGEKNWMDIKGTTTISKGEVTGIRWTGTNLPKSSGIREVRLNIEFTAADVAQKNFRVPKSAVFEVEYMNAATGTARNVSGFSNYRRLGATTAMSFD